MVLPLHGSGPHLPLRRNYDITISSSHLPPFQSNRFPNDPHSHASFPGGLAMGILRLSNGCWAGKEGTGAGRTGVYHITENITWWWNLRSGCGKMCLSASDPPLWKEA